MGKGSKRTRECGDGDIKAKNHAVFHDETGGGGEKKTDEVPRVSTICSICSNRKKKRRVRVVQKADVRNETNFHPQSRAKLIVKKPANKIVSKGATFHSTGAKLKKTDCRGGKGLTTMPLSIFYTKAARKSNGREKEKKNRLPYGLRSDLEPSRKET